MNKKETEHIMINTYLNELEIPDLCSHVLGFEVYCQLTEEEKMCMREQLVAEWLVQR